MKKNKTQTAFCKIRALEAELPYATPKRAAQLAEALVRLKNTLFDGDRKDNQ